MHIEMCVHTYTQACKNTHKQTHANVKNTQTHTHIGEHKSCIERHTQTLRHRNTHTGTLKKHRQNNTHTHTHTHAHIYWYTLKPCTCTHTQNHNQNTYIFTYTNYHRHIYIHTHTHTHRHTRLPRSLGPGLLRSLCGVIIYQRLPSGRGKKKTHAHGPYSICAEQICKAV